MIHLRPHKTKDIAREKNKIDFWDGMITSWQDKTKQDVTIVLRHYNSYKIIHQFWGQDTVLIQDHMIAKRTDHWFVSKNNQ